MTSSPTPHDVDACAPSLTPDVTGLVSVPARRARTPDRLNAPADRLAGRESVAAAALDIINASVMASIRRAADTEDDDALEDAIVIIIGKAAVHWEAQGWMHPSEVRQEVERARRMSPPTGLTLLSAASATTPRFAGAIPTDRIDAARTASAPVITKAKWEAARFWRSWADWTEVLWSRDVERAVREGINADVLATVAGRERHDLEAVIDSLIEQVAAWRGRSPTKEEVDGAPMTLLRRLYLRYLSAKVQPAQRVHVISAAAAAFEGGGLTEEQKAAKQAADRATLLTASTAWGQVDALASLPGGFSSQGAAHRQHRRESAGRAAAGRTMGRRWAPPAFAGACYNCNRRGHRASECPALNGDAPRPAEPVTRAGAGGSGKT